MKTTNELIMELIKNEFNRNQLILNDSNSSDNIWLMCAALIPFSENSYAADFLPYLLPGYVDYGTDVYVTASIEHQTADFIWEDMWIEAAPKYHGGTVGDSLEWVREMSEPFHTQFTDPFLNEEQRMALNGPEDVFH